jgi:DNA invertase Pin-like site-specific DNA recombinase
MTAIGYARVSTSDQVLDLQVDALRSAGCERIFEDTASGVKTARPGLEKALAFIRDGDVLVVWKLDRLGRSVGHLVDTVQRIEAAGAGFRSLTEGIDTTTTTGRLLLHLFASLAQFERDLIKDRINAGVKAAKARGRSGGRPRVMDDIKAAKADRMIAAGQLTLPEIAGRLGVGESTLRSWRRDRRQAPASSESAS